MNHVELIKSISKRLNITPDETERRMTDLISVITEQLLDENTVSLINFGSFEVKKKDERINTHPGSGKKMLFPPKLILKFKPATALNKKVKESSHE